MNKFNCQRCDSENIRIDPIKMTGEYHTRLCVNCRNTWNQYVKSHPCWIKGLEIDMKIQQILCQIKQDGKDRSEELISLRLEINELDLQMFDVAEEFVTEAMIPKTVDKAEEKANG